MNVITRKVSTFAVLIALTSLSGCLSSGGSGDAGTPDVPGGNVAPTIGGTPPSTVTIGNTYAFMPTTTDADGDTLTFSISNQPGWAVFDTATGELRGVPTVADVGTYPNITISVTDGSLTASLGSFSIDVSQVAVGAATLSWTAPTENEDGSTLTDLAGYRIYYGTSSGNYTTTIVIDNPSITTYVVEDLSPATYYFAAKSYTSLGIESKFSGEAVKTIN
jgi:hypothetical protein